MSSKLEVEALQTAQFAKCEAALQKFCELVQAKKAAHERDAGGLCLEYVLVSTDSNGSEVYEVRLCQVRQVGEKILPHFICGMKTYSIYKWLEALLAMTDMLNGIQQDFREKGHFKLTNHGWDLLVR